MKKLVILSSIALVIAACGGNPEATGDLAILQKEKDSLKQVKSDISSRLVEIEEEITKLDTTKTLPLVTVKTTKTETFEHFFKVYGSLATDQNAMIYPEISGAITGIKVAEGQNVSKGQTLIVLDVSILRQQEAELKTRLDLAQITYEKQKKLWDKQIGSEMQFLQAKNNYEALKNNLAALQAQIAKGIITAPFAGIVDEIFPKVGEVAMPGMGLIRLVNVTNMYVEADISEDYLSKIKEGDKVVLSIPSMNIEKHSTIKRMGQFINPNNRTFKIRVEVANQDQLLKPNMVTLININDFRADSAIVLPSSMVLDGAQNTRYVYVLPGNSSIENAEKRVIDVGMIYNNMAYIKSGLNAGERVISKGARSIKNGDKVEVKS
jgi:RND family efflux transporter MFP subunit